VVRKGKKLTKADIQRHNLAILATATVTTSQGILTARACPTTQRAPRPIDLNNIDDCRNSTRRPEVRRDQTNP